MATVEKDFKVKNGLVIGSDTESTSSSTGALIVAGGVGIAKNLNVQGDIYQNGIIFTPTDPYATTFGLLNI